MINRSRKIKEQPWTTKDKTAAEIIGKALDAMGELESYQFVRTGRKCSIMAALTVACGRKFESYKKRHPHRTPAHEQISCNFLEICDELEERFQRNVPTDAITDILVDLLPELVKEQMVIKLQNGSYIITDYGARIAAKYQQAIDKD